ncbi:MAG: lipid-A-disaccharide synthase [Myxococcaceae bacterium]
MGALDVLVVAGESSGDQHAADLVAELQRKRPDLHFFGMGGPKLAARFVDRIYDASEVNVMGITEVLPKLRRILRVMDGLGEAAARRTPACAILVDIPDFNLRFARRLKALGIPVVYYVSPTVWAWRKGRLDAIAARVDRMLCILPFEERFYTRHRVPVTYVGNPVVEQVPKPASAVEFRRALGLSETRPTLALLPGSRGGELHRLLPTMLRAARVISEKHPGLQLALPVAPSVDRAWIVQQIKLSGLGVALIDGKAPEVVGASDVALVASGTATLEAALMERPLVVVYRVATVSYWVGRALVDVPHIALPNLLLGDRVVPELLQGELTVARVVAEVERLWPGMPDHARVVSRLKGLRPLLSPGGATAAGAASKAADAVLAELHRGVNPA